MIVAVVALVAALVSLCVSLGLLLRVWALSRSLELAPQARLDPPPAALPEAAKPLEGLRIALAVKQDHPHPVFANLLKEHLLRQDVSDVSFTSVSDFAAWKESDLRADILIAGSLTCNGYAEVYYQAEFSCYTANEPICTVIERPPGGDRPENLAMELVTKMGLKLDELLTRNERRRAIGELRGG